MRRPLQAVGIVLVVASSQLEEGLALATHTAIMRPPFGSTGCSTRSGYRPVVHDVDREELDELERLTDAFFAAELYLTGFGEQLGSEGHTPGFWKNHLSAWAGTGFDPSDTLDSVFTGNRAPSPGQDIAGGAIYAFGGDEATNALTASISRRGWMTMLSGRLRQHSGQSIASIVPSR